MISIASSFVSATSELCKILYVVVRLITTLNHVSNVGIAFHVISIIAIIVHVSTTAALILDHRFLKLELVLQNDLTETLNQRAHSLTMSCLELACWHVKLDIHLL